MRRPNDSDSLDPINASLRTLGVQHESGDIDTYAYLAAQRRLLTQATLSRDATAAATGAQAWLARAGLYLAILMVVLTVLALISFFVN